ncbi:TPA: ribonuclease HII [candidate division WOR-3 bacterium]|uniref:Ribonuclease HII n=1 Tax=candidate division WOR-3 bacterium TaxID=2052148 RepID=A0A350HAW3_UNCW3|nr:ribonuclease HII [candidate division WOR-3 bacterium]
MTENLRKYEEKWWKNHCYYIAGVDEAGRGPLAGPVVSAAVIFSDDIQIKGINDSKQLTPEEREALFHEIMEKAVAVGVGYVDNMLIDRINILQSTYLSMLRSIKKLSVMPDIVLVDGYPIPDLPLKQENIIKGDAKSISIAAASIVAKVHRDRIMEFYGMEYPEYDFQSNKGYATKKHVEIVFKKGPCEIHRKTFSPIKEILNRIFGGTY